VGETNKIARKETAALIGLDGKTIETINRGRWTAVTITSGGSNLEAQANDNGVLLFDRPGGQPLQHLVSPEPAERSIREISFAPGGQILAAGVYDRDGNADSKGMTLIWNVVSGAVQKRLSHPGPVRSLSFSPDGRVLGIATANGIAELWDWEHGRLLRAITYSDKALGKYGLYAHLLFASGGNRLIIGVLATIGIWDALNGREIARIDTSGYIRDMVLSPNGDQLIVATRNTARIWDVTTLRESSRIIEDQEIEQLDVDRGGKYVLTYTRNGITPWLARSADLIEEVCKLLPERSKPDDWEQYSDELYPHRCPGKGSRSIIEEVIQNFAGS
jgi:WD40 repeat protein